MKETKSEREKKKGELETRETEKQKQRERGEEKEREESKLAQVFACSMHLFAFVAFSATRPVDVLTVRTLPVRVVVVWC